MDESAITLSVLERLIPVLNRSITARYVHTFIDEAENALKGTGFCFILFADGLSVRKVGPDAE